MLPAFNIVLLQPTGYIHSMALHEVGLLLYHSLASLGYPCRYQINQIELDAINILVGYHLLDDASAIPPCRFIVYQLEQLSDREGWFRTSYLEIFRRAEAVWDYSTDNIQFLLDNGFSNVQHLPVGFHEKLRVIESQTAEFDVLFYGCLNARREAILRDLERDCRVKVLFGCYGQERDQYIAQSKVVLNIHFYEAQIMEQPRIAYLLNNARFVLSEESPTNPYSGFLQVASYPQLAKQCRDWLSQTQAREQKAQEGYERFREKPMTETLKALLMPTLNL